jgi:energy-coupling factor transporter transmembrane protein EcfT
MYSVLDPRTKLILMIFTVITATQAPDLTYELLLILLITILGFMLGRKRYAVLGAFLFMLLYLLVTCYVRERAGTIYTMIIAWLSLVFQVYPCGMLAGIVIPDTKVNEFLSAMSKIRVSKKIVVPLIIMMRYFPVIGEDWRQIKDAMRMRDVELSLKGLIRQPGLTIECLYVPLLMAASKAADELTIAAVTRGIENPKARTCLIEIKFRIQDYLLAGIFGGLAIGCFIRF